MRPRFRKRQPEQAFDFSSSRIGPVATSQAVTIGYWKLEIFSNGILLSARACVNPNEASFDHTDFDAAFPITQ
ncbi:UNVERIFIED_CONTAM: hypothetical protein PYX00_002644 [Menopon gallinae]|uniref:Uncharacterized protein n=1 Tax=Menopon gallinae TaxID=328185 RepID=A0AAW2HY10_9NEOP